MNFREELAWAAGLFDGEGWVGIRRRGARHKAQLALSITQADQRVLGRFRAAVSVGGVYGPYDVGPAHYKPRWSYVAVDFADAQAVVAMIWAWLSPVKRQQAREAVMAARAAEVTALKRQADRPTCKRGHPFSEAVIYFQKAQRYRSRKCNRCRAFTERERRGVRRMVSALLEA